MWIANNDLWVEGLYPIEKFFTERIIQRCDYDESITNQHRTTNGYIQLKELVTLSKLSLIRGRTIRTVKVLLEEAKSPLFAQNIANDTIIKDYFVDLRAFILQYEASRLIGEGSHPNLTELNTFIHRLSIFEAQLEKSYFLSLRREFFNVKFKETDKVERQARRLGSLIDLLIPYLVFKGFAISSLSGILRSWIDKKYRATIDRIFRYINFEERQYGYLLKVDDHFLEEWKMFIRFMRAEQNMEIIIDNVATLKNGRPELQIFPDEQKIAIYNHSDLDPYAHFRYIYDSLLKRVVQTRERQSLAVFNDFFTSCYWRLPKKGKQYHLVKFTFDPLNVNSRSRTLRSTLIDSRHFYNYTFSEDSPIPNPLNEQVRNSLYYYNLALGSKSIENSLSLLWTSLEALLPYRTFYSDIDCVQHFVSKSLAIGAISRDVKSFFRRLNEIDMQNPGDLTTLNLPFNKTCDSPESLHSCYKWLTEDSTDEIKRRFQLFRAKSELLAFEYSRIAKPLIEGKNEYLLTRVTTSYYSIQYQLQRIYLHRNQIIHAGNLINEYTNLWIHLEWYIGKLLAHAIINLEILSSYGSLSELFISLEADYDYVLSYLEKNSKLPIKELSARIEKILFSNSWQSN